MKSILHKHMRSAAATGFSALLLTTPTFLFAADTTITNPLSDVHIYCFLISMLQVLVSILIPAVVITLVIAGFLLVEARGNPVQLVSAKKFLLWTLVAAALTLGIFGLISLAQGTINTIFPGLVTAPACPNANSSSSEGNNNFQPLDNLADTGGDTSGGNFPSVPHNMKLAAIAPDSTEVDLSWDAPTNNVNVAGYVIYRNNQRAADMPGETLTYTDFGVNPDTSYTYSIAALDSSGNVLSQSDPVPVAVPEPVAGGDPSRHQCNISFTANETPATFGLVDFDSANTARYLKGTANASSACLGSVTLSATNDKGESIGSVSIAPGGSKSFSFPDIVYNYMIYGTNPNIPYVLPDGRRVNEMSADPTVMSTKIVASDACNSTEATVQACFEGYDIFTADGKSSLSCPSFTSSVNSPPVKASSGQAVTPTANDIVAGSIKLSFDPDFVTNTINNRHFTPTSPFSPYDDIKISLQLKTCGQKPQTLPFKISLVTTDPANREGLLALSSSPVFTLVPGTASSVNPTYEAIIKGWSGGIVNQAAMVTLLDSITNNRPILFRITSTNPADTEHADVPVPMTACTGDKPKTITISGIGSTPDHPIFAWMRAITGNLAPVEISLDSKTVAENTNIIRDAINAGLNKGQKVLVVAHSLGSIILYNLRSEFKTGCMIPMYVDPPYSNFFATSPFCSIGAALCSDAARAIQQAAAGGIANDPHIIIWTNGKGMGQTHDPWTYPTYNNNAQNLAELKAKILLTLGALSSAPVGTTQPSSVEPPKNFKVTSSDSTKVSLSWNIVAVQTGKAIYRILRNDQAYTETTDTNYIDFNVTPGTSYTYSIAALDSSGNVLSQSDPVPVAVPEPVAGGDPSRHQCNISFTANSTPSIFELDQNWSVKGTITASANCVGPVSLGGFNANGPAGSITLDPGTSKSFEFPGQTINSGSGAQILPDGRHVPEMSMNPTIFSQELSATDACGSVSTDVMVESCFAGYDIFTIDGKSSASCPDFDSQVQSPSVTAIPADQQNSVTPTVSQIVPGSIKLSFDEGYVAETEADRKFTPSGDFSPYDDIKISLQLKTCGQKPQTLPFGVVIATKNSKGADVLIPIQAFPFTLDQNTATSPTPTYNVTAVGWPDSLSAVLDQYKETLIDSIANKRPVSFHILDDSGKFQDVPVPMTNCVQEYGAGDLRVVSMRGVSAALSPDDLMSKSADIRENGFQIIDPFRTYFDQFSFYSDIANYNEGGTDPKEVSSCGNKGSLYFFYTKQTDVATSDYFSGEVLIRPDVESVLSSFGLPTPASRVAIHETAHGFAGIFDEYDYSNPGLPGHGIEPPTFDTQQTNCVIDPTNPVSGYVYNGHLYGDKDQYGCHTKFLNRPSSNSVMRHEIGLPGSDMFNVVSCGYVVAMIKGTGIRSGPSYWPECMTMDTIKPAIAP